MEGSAEKPPTGAATATSFTASDGGGGEKRSAPPSTEGEDVSKRQKIEEAVSSTISQAVSSVVRDLPIPSTTAKASEATPSITAPAASQEPPSGQTEAPAKAPSPKKVESPKKAMSPKKAESPKKVASPKKAESPKKAASPKKTESPKKAASPKKASSPKKATSPKRAASPKKPVSSEPLPVLSGRYRVECGIASWGGLWGFDESAFQSGKTSKFSFKSRATAGAVSLSGPVNGVYDGYFMFKVPNTAPRRIEEKGLQLNFTKQDDSQIYTVKGRGTNRFGAFELDGTLEDSILKATKTYTS